MSEGKRADLGKAGRPGETGCSAADALEFEGSAQPLSKRATISAGCWIALRWKSGSESFLLLRRG